MFCLKKNTIQTQRKAKAVIYILMLISANKMIDRPYLNSEFKQEFLFDNLGAPLGTFEFLDEAETELFIKMPGGIKAFKGPQENTVVLLLLAEPDGVFHQPVAKTLATQFVRCNEPAQMSPFGFSLETVYGNGAFNPVVKTNGPESIALLIKAAQKLRQLRSHLGFEEQPEVPIFMVIGGVQFADPANRTRYVTCQLNIIHSSPYNVSTGAHGNQQILIIVQFHAGDTDPPPGPHDGTGRNKIISLTGSQVVDPQIDGADAG